MTKGNWEKYLALAVEIANYAGEVLKKYYTTDNGAEYKLDNTLVTLADKEINHYLITKVKQNFPDHAVDGEEESYGQSPYLWVCDPVDGTAMYVRRVPVAVFSLALCVDGEPMVGVVNDVFSGCLYTAIKGQGAYCNQQRIAVNTRGLDDPRSMAAFDTWTREYDLIDAYLALRKRTYFIHLGSFIRDSLCVANGTMEFALYPASKHKNCDLAAIKVIIEAAGGVVTDLYGNQQRYDQDIKGAIVSNQTVFPEISKIVRANGLKASHH